MASSNCNPKISAYQRQLDQLYAGGSWNAEYYLQKLEMANEEIAFIQPMHGVHSVGEIVWHVIYWRMCCIHWLDGDGDFKTQTLKALNFLPVQELEKKGWSALKSELHETQLQLVDRLRKSDDEMLSKEYQPNYTFDYLLEGQIHHDIYHLGQIGLVLKMLSFRRGV